MKTLPKTRLDAMGRFNNSLVELIDQAALTAPELLVVLTVITRRLENGLIEGKVQ